VIKGVGKQGLAVLNFQAAKKIAARPPVYREHDQIVQV
jgi:hypothetical protein